MRFFYSYFTLHKYEFISYFESNLAFLGSELGFFKYKLPIKCAFFSTYSQFLLIYKSFYYYFINNNNFSIGSIIYNIRLFILNSIFGSIGRFRLIGRGYKSYPFYNNFLFKLGYSHLVYYTMPLNVSALRKDKKHYFFRIISTDNVIIFNNLFTIKNFRIPNVYSKKGFFPLGEEISFKQGKKAFSL